MVFPRLRWQIRLEDELSCAALGVSRRVAHILEMDFELWMPEIGPVLSDLTQRLKGRYPPVFYGEWGVVPEIWECDPGVEQAPVEPSLLTRPAQELRRLLYEHLELIP